MARNLSTMEVSTFLNNQSAEESDDLPPCLRGDNFQDDPEDDLVLDRGQAPQQQEEHGLLYAPAPKFVDCSDPGVASLGRKSRTAVFMYPAQPAGTEARFVEDKAARITRMYENKIPRFGFCIRYASYFLHEDRLCMALVSKEALFFMKWHTVYRNLGAESVKVYYAENQYERLGGRTANGLVAVLDMFPHLTMEDLFDHCVQLAQPASRKAADKPPRKKRTPDESPRKKRKPDESPPAKRRASRASPESSPAAKRAASPGEAQTRRKVMRSIEYDREEHAMLPSLLLFDGPVDKLTRISKEFLTSPTIDGAQTLHDELKRYLSLPDSLGQVGLFLLRGGLNEMFAQVTSPQTHDFCPWPDRVFLQAVKLRDVALDVLASAACNLPTPSLATRDVRAQPGYQLLDGDVRARLDALTAFHDEVHSLITFAMYDQISVLVFMAVYILREKRPVKDDYFLSSEAGTLIETPCVYARYVALLQDFLFAMQDRGAQAVGDLSRFVFSRDMDEASIRAFFMRDFPSSFSDAWDLITRNQSRSRYRINRMTTAVRKHAPLYPPRASA